MYIGQNSISISQPLPYFSTRLILILLNVWIILLVRNAILVWRLQLGDSNWTITRCWMLKSPQLSISNTEQNFGIMIRNIRRTDRVSMNPEILEPERKWHLYGDVKSIIKAPFLFDLAERIHRANRFYFMQEAYY